MRTVAHNAIRAFTDDDTCVCGGVFVPRRDGRPGRACGRCGAPEPGTVPLELWIGGRWERVLARAPKP